MRIVNTAAKFISIGSALAGPALGPIGQLVTIVTSHTDKLLD
jgi:hypothetical protein